MKLLRDFLCAIRRFRTSMAINIVGLMVAFAAFFIIMLQVSFENNYERHNSRVDKVYRVALQMEDGAVWAIWPQPMIMECINSSPHVVSGSSLYLNGKKDSYCKVKKDDGTEVIYEEKFAGVTPDIVRLLDLNIIAGDRNVLKHPNVYLIPKSTAIRMFGTADVVGKTIDEETIGAVYEDRPANSIVDNRIFYSTGKISESRFAHNYIFLVELDDPKNKDEVINAFNATLTKYYKGSWLDDGKSPFPTATMVSLADCYFTSDAEYDLPAKGSKMSVNISICIALLIIIIAIINYINFASALTPLRVKSINLKKIMGANVLGLRLSLLIESVAISLIAFVLAMGLVQLLSYTAMSSYIDANISLASNGAMVLKMALIAIVVGIVAGLYPALYMTSFPPILALKGAFGMSPKGRRYRAVLICFQFVVSMVLIIVTLFVNLQNHFVSKFDVGFDRSNVVCVNLMPELAKKANVITNQLKSLGDIDDVAYAKNKFGASDSYMFSSADYGGAQNTLNCIVVSPNLLDMLNIELSEGRRFRDQDKDKPYGTLIFNQAAKKLDPIKVSVGKLFGNYKGGDCGTGEIIGIASPKLHTLSLKQVEVPTCFCLNGTNGNGYDYTLCNAFIKIRKGANPVEAIEHIKQVFHKIEPAFSPDLEFFDKAVDVLYQKEHRAIFIVTAFSVLAIFISLMGVFGLVLFETQYRVKEIGVRRVFGVTIIGILRMINAKFVRIVLICFIIAAPISCYIVTRWLESYACKTPIYWWVFAVALLIVLVITIVTVTIRSYSVATSNPAAMVKSE